MPLEINNKTLTSAVISSLEFKESVEVNFDTLLQKNFF